MLFSIFDILRIFEALQIFFYKFLLKWGKMKKILSPAYFLKLKNIILYLNRGSIFFQMVIFATLFRRCPTLWKSTLKLTTLFQRCSVQFEIHIVVSMLLNVVNYNVDVHNVASTLIWRCAASQRHINPTITLSRRWNVCWERYEDMTMIEKINIIILVI